MLKIIVCIILKTIIYTINKKSKQHIQNISWTGTSLDMGLLAVFFMGLLLIYRSCTCNLPNGQTTVSPFHLVPFMQNILQRVVNIYLGVILTDQNKPKTKNMGLQRNRRNDLFDRLISTCFFLHVHSLWCFCRYFARNVN